MLRYHRQQASRPRRARRRDVLSPGRQFGTGSGLRGASTGLERRDGGNQGTNNNNNNGDGGNNKGNNNDKGGNNKKDSDSKSKDQPSTSSPPPPPPPTSTTVVVASTTSTLLTTATLTTIEQTSSLVQTTTSAILTTISSSLVEPASAAPQITSATVTPILSSTNIISSTTASSQITTSVASTPISTSAAQVLDTTATIPTDAAGISASPTAHRHHKSHGLSKSAQAGIAAGVISLVLLLAVIAFYLVARRRRQRRESSAASSVRSSLEKNADVKRASSPEMSGPLVAELDGSETGSSDGRSVRRSRFSFFSTWSPSHASSRSRASVSDLGEDTFSDAGSYRSREQHTYANAPAVGLSHPPSVARGVLHGRGHSREVSDLSLDDGSVMQLARSDSSVSALTAPVDTVPNVRGGEARRSGIGGLRILSIFPSKRSSRPVRNSTAGGRFSIAELEGDTFFVPGRDPLP